MMLAVGTAYSKLTKDRPDVEEVGQWLIGKVAEIEASATIDLVTLKQAATKAKNRMQDCISKGIGEGLSTGLRCIDETIGGLCSSEMVVLAARPGGGKTALGMQIAVNVAQNGVGVLFVSLEMEDYEIASRTLCAVSGISSKAIRNGTISQEQVDGLDQFIDSLDYPVVFYAPSTAGIRHIAAATRVAKSRQNIGLVVIDYLQKITPTDTRKPRHEQLEEISAAIKSRIAKEYKVPVLALCQLSRDSGGRPPRLEDLKGSGAIEQDADVVIGIHNAEGDTNAKELYILKNRHGEVGTLRVKWAAAATRFEDELLTEMT